MSNPFDMPKIDTRPGHYYVTMLRDDGTYLPLLGPLEGHQEALDRVRICSLYAAQLDPRATWCAFGTCRVELGAPGAVMEGVLNDRWPLRYAPGSQLVEREEPFRELSAGESGPTRIPAAASEFLEYRERTRGKIERCIKPLPGDTYLCATAQWQLVNEMRRTLVETEVAAGEPTGGLEGWVVRELGRTSLVDSFIMAHWLDFRPGCESVADWMYWNLKTQGLREGQRTTSLIETFSEELQELFEAGRPRKVNGDPDTRAGRPREDKGPPSKKRARRGKKVRATSGEPA